MKWWSFGIRNSFRYWTLNKPFALWQNIVTAVGFFVIGALFIVMAFPLQKLGGLPVALLVGIGGFSTFALGIVLLLWIILKAHWLPAEIESNVDFSWYYIRFDGDDVVFHLGFKHSLTPQSWVLVAREVRVPYATARRVRKIQAQLTRASLTDLSLVVNFWGRWGDPLFSFDSKAES